MSSSVPAPQLRCKVISSRVSALTPAAQSTVTVYDERDCIGFISRGKAGYNAFNRDEVHTERYPFSGASRFRGAVTKVCQP
jgi:hypothetical protein